MEKIIKDYILYMKEKHGVTAAMVTGSYVTGEMGPRSDIDLFFIWSKEYESMRGREYFNGVEFEYFISPEWKYYDRLRTDKTSMRIYSSSNIICDPDGRLRKIKKVAQDKVNEYSCNLNEDTRKDYKFWLETISADGEDLFEKGDYNNFLFFTGTNLPRMANLLTSLKNKLPVYEKYGHKEVAAIDKSYGEILEKFMLTDYRDEEKKKLWVSLCQYLQDELGDFDIINYESRQLL